MQVLKQIISFFMFENLLYITNEKKITKRNCLYIKHSNCRVRKWGRKSRIILCKENLIKYKIYLLMYGTSFIKIVFTLNIVFVNKRIFLCYLKNFFLFSPLCLSVCLVLICLFYSSLIYQLLRSYGQFFLVFVFATLRNFTG